MEMEQQNNEFQSIRRKSVVWEHFSIEYVGGSRRAYCNQCKISYAYGKTPATSNLLRHIAQGHCQVLGNQHNNERFSMEQQNYEQVLVGKPQPKNEFQFKRRKTFLWEHFTVEHVGGRSGRAYCNHCKKSYSYSKGSRVDGTSHLRNHIDTCQLALRNQQNNE